MAAIPVLCVLILIAGLTEALFDTEGAGNEVKEDVTYVETFSRSFPFANQTVQEVHIADNGVISFGKDFLGSKAADYDPPSDIWIAPYGVDVGGHITFGKIFFAEYGSADTDQITMATQHVKGQFTSLKNFTPDFVYVVTWQEVRSHPAVQNVEVNTFQVALVTNRVKSYAIFLYGTLQWGSAVVGISAGDSTNVYKICGSGTSTVQTLTTLAQSACGTPGVFVFRVDSLPWGKAGYTCSQTFTPAVDCSTTTTTTATTKTTTTARANRCRKR